MAKKESEQKSRKTRQTIVTSVSLSKEFKDLIEDYNISPTEAMRVGISTILYGKGLPQFNNKLNEERFKNMQELMRQDKFQERVNELFEKIKDIDALSRELKILMEVK